MQFTPPPFPLWDVAAHCAGAFWWRVFPSPQRPQATQVFLRTPRMASRYTSPFYPGASIASIVAVSLSTAYDPPRPRGSSVRCREQ